MSWEGVGRGYGSANPDAPEHWVTMVDGRAVGWIQCYPTTDNSPEEANAWFALGVDASARHRVRPSSVVDAGRDSVIGVELRTATGVGAASARIAQQRLDAGLVDELQVSLVPVILGDGVRWFDNLDSAPFLLDGPSMIEGAGVRHLSYQVRR